MKKIGIMLAVLVLCAVSASATRISKSKAQAKAVSFFQKGLVKANGAEVKLVKEYASSAEAPAAVFAFSRGENVVFVSAEDKMPSILGYSSNADVNNLPPALEEMLRYYAHLSDAVREGRIEAPKLYASAEPVDSLIHTCWYQEAPFWNLCPESEGFKTATGCVATALAMVLKYHNWPEKPEGKAPKYTTKSMKIEIPEVDLSSHTYKWDDMINVYKEGEYTEEQGQAVAQLMYDIGVASKMNYKVEGSGTAFSIAADPMRKYFKYNKGLHIDYAKFHTEEEWATMLKNEISQKRPLPYSAFWSLSNDAHCFVIDGFNAEGLFHVNWGWGGRSNGFFLITTLDPKEEGIIESKSEGGYSNTQCTLFDFVPDKKGTTTPIEHFFFQYNNCCGVEGDQVLISAFQNLSIDEFHGNLILQIVDKDNNVIDKKTIKENYSIEVDGEEDFRYIFLNEVFDFSKFADGMYHTDMIAVSSATGKEYPVKHVRQDDRFIVENGKLKAILKGAKLEGEITGYENVAYQNNNLKMTVKGKVTNIDDIDLHLDDVLKILITVKFIEDDKAEQFNEDIRKNIKPGETVTFEEDLDVWFYSGKRDITKATLVLQLISGNGIFATKEIPFSELIATGIKDININKVEGKSPAYSLDGKRVSDDYKGIIIKDSKKTLSPLPR